MTYALQLDQLVAEYLEERIALPEFQARFSSLFVDEIPDTALDEQQWEFYGAIHEKAEWTAPDPPTQDKRDGWLSADEFRAWLRSHVRSG